MTNPNKVSAFTLTELMVVLALSTIVTGLAFAVLQSVQNNMAAIQVNYDQQSQVQLLETALLHDLNSYTEAYWNADRQTLQFSSPINERAYVFHSDSISNSQHTFVLRIHSPVFYFQGKEVVSGRIDGIRLQYAGLPKDYYSFVFGYTDPTIYF